MGRVVYVVAGCRVGIIGDGVLWVVVVYVVAECGEGVVGDGVLWVVVVYVVAGSGEGALGTGCCGYFVRCYSERGCGG